MFSESREDVNDKKLGERSSTTTEENVDEVIKTVLVNRRVTIRDVAWDLDIPISSYHSGSTDDLSMR
nr:unnamed protein product [Callosobruchus analis]